MEFDVLGLLAACSYALDCVEAELVHITSRHAKRVAYMSVCVAEQMGVQGKALQDLAVCALLHDNALTQYIQERIMACADIYQALTESRPYKKGMSHEQAYSILKDMADKGWLDPEVTAQVDACFGS